jgi:hypothetical protein
MVAFADGWWRGRKDTRRVRRAQAPCNAAPWSWPSATTNLPSPPAAASRIRAIRAVGQPAPG